jgi:hypothetical protein
MSLSHHLPSPRGGVDVQAKQPAKDGHSHPNVPRGRGALSCAYVFNQLLPTKHNNATVKIEERKTCACDLLGDIPCPAKQEFNPGRPEMSAMSYMFVESGHGTAGSGDHQSATGTHVLASTPQQLKGIVNVFDDLRTDCVRCTVTQVLGRVNIFQQIALHESRVRDLAPRDFHTRPTQFQSQYFSRGEIGADHRGHVSLAAADIEHPNASAGVTQTEER